MRVRGEKAEQEKEQSQGGLPNIKNQNISHSAHHSFLIYTLEMLEKQDALK
jgi:hypothetical protein